ncbi:2-dehydropantoate 2-reductase, partial [Streptomyces daliensis]|nr:2-dehydropantoate 2-reductase [Streptomyces daliensis]
MNPAPTTTPARTAVIGGGGIGGLVAALLHEAGHDVTLCLRAPLDELTVHTDGQVLRPALSFATRPEEQRPVEWLFLTTKAQDTEGAADWLRQLSGPGTTVVVVQNGVDHAARVSPLLPPGADVLPALAYMSTERVAPGRIVHHAANELHVPAGASADGLCALLADSGIEVRPVTDFTTAIWRKLFTNLAANPVTALLQQRIRVLGEPGMHQLAGDILREAAEVGRAEGADIGEEDVRRTLAMYERVPADGGTSMLYDRLAGRPLEHEHITGPVVRAGERHGIPTPLNGMLLTLLRAVDRDLRAQQGQE